MNMLQIFPAGVKIKNPAKPIENMIIEEKSLTKMYENIDMDPFLEDYVKKCQKTAQLPVFEEVNYDVSELCAANLENATRELPKYCPECRNKQRIESGSDMKSFSEDFNKNIRYGIFK